MFSKGPLTTKMPRILYMVPGRCGRKMAKAKGAQRPDFYVRRGVRFHLHTWMDTRTGIRWSRSLLKFRLPRNQRLSYSNPPNPAVYSFSSDYAFSFQPDRCNVAMPQLACSRILGAAKRAAHFAWKVQSSVLRRSGASSTIAGCVVLAGYSMNSCVEDAWQVISRLLHNFQPCTADL